MQNQEVAYDGREDHDYHLPRSEDESSMEDFVVPIHRELNRSRDNTDHDYLGAEPDNVIPYGDENVGVPERERALEQVPNETEMTAEQAIHEPTEHVNEQESVDSNPLESLNSIANEEVIVLPTPSGADPNESIINLTSPTPPKKRKRLSINTPKMKKPVNEEEEDDGLTCPICLDSWEMSGEHRLVALKCGHLFGDSCIRRWLTESARQSGIKACPQCKAKAIHRDIRCLYAKRLRAIDRSEEHHLREQLDQEKSRCNNLQTELATLKLTYASITCKIQSLEADNERLKHVLRSGGAGMSGGFSYEGDSKSQLLHNYKLFMEKNIEISKEPGCRVMLYAEKQSAMIVSQKSSQSLFPGYGLRFIDTPTFRPSTFLHASAKLLRDISLSHDQNQLAVASMETRTKLFDLRTRQVAAVFTPSEKALWACAMDRNERENLLYLGAQHGSTYVYDVRFPETVVDEFKTEGDLSPVINVAPVPISKYFPCGGFLVCKLQSLWFYEYSSATGTASPNRLNVEGPFISMNFDTTHETLLISARSSQRYPQSRYILGKLKKIDELPVLNVKVSFFGSKATPVMTRCTQIAVESNTLIAGYIQDVKLLALFDARREQRLQSMPVQEVVYDTCPVYIANATYLAALTETKCRIYKLNTTSS